MSSMIEDLYAAYWQATSAERMHQRERGKAATKRADAVSRLVKDHGLTYAAIGRQVDLTSERVRKIATRKT